MPYIERKDGKIVGMYEVKQEFATEYLADDSAEILAYGIPTYAEKRSAEYPAIADYLDGIVKGNQAQVDKYIADCKAVKEKYPKPQ